ncbi:hypothetical protein ACROYT_G019427 [Oculina patagonica]
MLYQLCNSTSLRLGQLAFLSNSSLDERYIETRQPKASQKKEDIFPVRTQDSMEHLVNKLEKLWEQEVTKSRLTGCKPRLWKAFCRMFSWKAYTWMIILKLLRSLSTVFLPLLLWFFLSDLEKESQEGYSASSFVLVAGMILLAVSKGLTKSHFAGMAEIWGVQLKVASIGLIYKKILTKLKRSDIQKILTGKTINLVSNDGQKLEKVVWALFLLLFAPLEILASCVILWLLIGWRALAGVAFYVIALVYIILISHQSGQLRRKTAAATDRRLEAMNEIVSGIRAVKMYSWESSFAELIKQLRRKEMRFVRLRGLIICSLYSLNYTSTPFAGLISIVTLIITGEHVTAFKTFTILSSLHVINFCICVLMASTLHLVTEGNIAVKRIEKFMTREYDISFGNVDRNYIAFAKQLGPNGCLSVNLKRSRYGPKIVRQESFKVGDPKLLHVLESGTVSNTDNIDLTLVGVSAAWDRHEDRKALKDISFSVYKGEMLAVTGPVGSGKSSLLMAILGELPTVNGKVSFNGRIAYLPQMPWVFSGTIRDNILFGRSFETKRYQDILEVCCMQEDLQNFPKGDLTEIGHRGVSLSGGQRTRVSLARALYSDADIYLLDDPLSAVDAKVGKHLFDSCICGFLSDRTRVFVTHQLDYLTHLDNIIVLSEGAEVNRRVCLDELKNSKSLKFAQVEGAAFSGDLAQPQCQMQCQVSEMEDLKEEDEDRSTGSITWKLYWIYFRTSLAAPIVFCLFIIVVGVKGLLLASYWWMSEVSEMSHEEQRSSKTIGTYGALVGSNYLGTVITSFLFYSTLLKASETLHNKMVWSVIKTPVQYFDKTPVGRILNRFSKDIGNMDDVLPPQFLLAVEVFLFVICTILLPVAANVWLLFAAIPLIIIAVYYVRYYLKSAREIKRLEAITCSPVYSHISETITGLEIIRSSQMEQHFLRKLFKYQDENTSALVMVITSTQWLSVRMTLVCSIMIAAAAVGAVLVTQSPALAGMSLSFLLESLDEVQYSVRAGSEVENLMTSVERVTAYTALEAEPGYSTANHPPETWPQSGRITIKNMSLKYIEGGPRVLKDINLSIADKEKIGVAGRTGAGKSSIVAALLRMPEPEGQVFIDDVDIGTLNLQEARRSMAVIAQDPVLFEGSLIRNLDPFSSYTDLELWSALEEVQLKGTVEKLPGQLNYQLKEAGSNFSVGERQLVCLARALVQKSKIIIMDEATANVDFKTGRLIQEVIRQKFKESTVLTIAHRLNTIMDYDKVLVLDGGRVVEFDKPEMLIANGGLFSELVKHANQTKNEAK